MKPRIFFDMDGTLAYWNGKETFEEMRTAGFYANLKPMRKVINLAKELIEAGYDVYVLSKYIEEMETAVEEKEYWVNKYLPEIDQAHRIFVPCSKDKSDYIPGGIQDTDYLIDDYTTNLKEFILSGGKAIKLRNNFNCKNGVWQGERLSYTSRSLMDDIRGSISNIMSMSGSSRMPWVGA